MKKLFFLIVAFATMVICPSCSDDKDGPEAGLKEQIVGTWEGTAIYHKGEWVDITGPLYDDLAFSATFNANGTYYGSGSFGNGSGTYKINGNTIETYVDGELYLKYKVKEITGTTAELTIIEDDDSLDVRVKKTK